MKKVEIELYSFDELNEESKEVALVGEGFFLEWKHNPELTGIPKRVYKKSLTSEMVVNSILAKDLLFFSDGIEAEITRYANNHQRAGEIELVLGNQSFLIEKPAPIMTVSFDDIIKEQKLETFASGFSDEDTELPYVFDLHWDIKSVGHLAHDLKNNCFDNPAADVIETMFDYGLTPENLTKYYKKKGE